MADCCVALRRIHLSGYHVFSLLLLRLGFGSWSDCHGGCCHVRALHVLDCLVRRFSTQPSRPRIGPHPRSREFCLRHPELRDVCDVGQMLYFGWSWAWYFTAAMFLLNNTFIQVRFGRSDLSPSLTSSGSPRLNWCQISEHHERWRSMHRWLFRDLGGPFLLLLSSKDVRHSFEACDPFGFFHIPLRPFGSHLCWA